MMKPVRTVLGALLALHVSAAGAQDTASIMHNVYDAIAYLLPLSVRTNEGQTEWDSELIGQKLDVLTQASSTLVSHAAEQGGEFYALARSFDSLVQDTATSFRKEWPEFAYYTLMELTDHCANCHARLPAQSQVYFGQHLMARMNLKDLSYQDKALIYRATRQFDAALTLYEKEINDPHTPALEAEYQGVLVQYLVAALAVDGGIARAINFLGVYAKRDDLPYYLLKRLERWRRNLSEHAGKPDAPLTLENAFALFDGASAANLVPGNRSTAVDDLLAARAMRIYLNTHDEIPGPLRAKIYYRLAIIALRTSEPAPAVPEMEMLLVAALEADPRGAYAKSAYELLEEYGYINQEHLARQTESQSLIDMAEMRKLAGITD